jgi:Zn finger protein HypA/HybF involved in hydrogenase expression
VTGVAEFHRTLDQELAALERGASLECLVCGEFVLHLSQGSLLCPECGSGIRAGGEAEGGLQLSLQAG